jgi:hypothetical protein
MPILNKILLIPNQIKLVVKKKIINRFQNSKENIIIIILN